MSIYICFMPSREPASSTQTASARPLLSRFSSLAFATEYFEGSALFFFLTLVRVLQQLVEL